MSGTLAAILYGDDVPSRCRANSTNKCNGEVSRRTGYLPQLDATSTYSCAGNGSIVSGFTGTWTSSLYGEVISVTRILGNASMNDM